MKKSTKSGFTLIEALVAVTIVTFAVAGPLFSANRAIVSAQGARLQLVASHLAQEGIEQVRAVRDNEYLVAYKAALSDNSIDPSSVSWSNFAGLISQCNPVCTLDSSLSTGVGSDKSLQPCSGVCTPTPLYLNSRGYTQQSDGNTLTPYTRTITSEPISGNEKRIISKVSWSFHGVPYIVTVRDHLSAWQ